MELGIKEIRKLLIEKELELEKGAKLLCSDQVRPVFSIDGTNVIIEFESPFVYIFIDTLGSMEIFDIKRKVNRIVLGESTVTLEIDDFPDITRKL